MRIDEKKLITHRLCGRFHLLQHSSIEARKDRDRNNTSSGNSLADTISYNVAYS